MNIPFLNLRSNIEEKLDIPVDLAKDLPRLEVMGNEEVTIENHQGILGFEKNKVEVNSNSGRIIINGTNLEILFMGGETLTIGGNVQSIIYEGVNKK